MKVVIEIADAELDKFCKEAQCSKEEAISWIKYDFQRFKDEYFGLNEE